MHILLFDKILIYYVENISIDKFYAFHNYQILKFLYIELNIGIMTTECPEGFINDGFGLTPDDPLYECQINNDVYIVLQWITTLFCSIILILSARGIYYTKNQINKRSLISPKISPKYVKNSKV